MENSERLEYKVGLFVGIGLIILMSSILLLGGNRIVFKSYYDLRTYFSEVQGLFPGSVVSLSGVPVGNVKSIRFAPESMKLEVVLQIDEQFKNRFTQGSIADVRTQGALGDKFIYVKPGPPEAPLLPEGSVLESDDSGGILGRLTDEKDGVGQVLDLIKELRILVASLNAEGRTGSMVTNMSETVVQSKNTLAQLELVLKDMRGQLPQNQKFRESVEALASILQKVDSGQGTLGALVNDPSVHQGLKSFLGTSPRNRYLKNMIRETIEQGSDKK